MVIFLVIFSFLLISYALLINYYRRSWNRIPSFVPDSSEPGTSISVIISVRNEEKNLATLIQSLNVQNYPAALLEVLIIDDHSADGSWSILQSLTRNSNVIRCLRLADLITVESQTQAYKKMAITKAIDLARGELIVTTDADCVFDPDWLLYIASFYRSTKAKFIAAPVKIKNDNRFLSLFQAIDFLTLQGITGASVYSRFHTMCNGANLAYEKKAFLEVEGFKGVDKIPSGDDMLLMYKIYKRYPEQVFYLKSRQTIVTTNAMNTWRDFFYQRIRWASKATYYDDKKLFWILLLVYCINLCFLVLGTAAFWNATWFLALILTLSVKVFIEFPFVNTVATFFDEKRLMKYFLFLQPFHILYTIIAGWLGKFGSYEWKGRRIKQ
jgi:cellulose synthase/poly-beta-1,6-N-acetylglucosamine synthase-like glycosyltransferase